MLSSPCFGWAVADALPLCHKMSPFMPSSNFIVKTMLMGNRSQCRWCRCYVSVTLWNQDSLHNDKAKKGNVRWVNHGLTGFYWDSFMQQTNWRNKLLLWHWPLAAGPQTFPWGRPVALLGPGSGPRSPSWCFSPHRPDPSRSAPCPEALLPPPLLPAPCIGQKSNFRKWFEEQSREHVQNVCLNQCVKGHCGIQLTKLFIVFVWSDSE